VRIKKCNPAGGEFRTFCVERRKFWLRRPYRGGGDDQVKKDCRRREIRREGPGGTRAGRKKEMGRKSKTKLRIKVTEGSRS